MPNNIKLRPRYEIKKAPEKAIKELRDYAEERGIERGEAFGEVMEIVNAARSVNPRWVEDLLNSLACNGLKCEKCGLPLKVGKSKKLARCENGNCEMFQTIVSIEKEGKK